MRLKGDIMEDNQKLKQMKVQTALLACILIVVIVVSAFVVIQFVSMRNGMDELKENLQNIDTQAINDAIASLESAADNLKDVDIDSLNSLIESLNTTSERMEAAGNAISGLFGR